MYDVPTCYYCGKPLSDGKGYVSFWRTHLRYCSPNCLDTAEREWGEAIQIPILTYRFDKYGMRNWAVYDSNEEMVCVTVYRKGAEEVIRRLSATK